MDTRRNWGALELAGEGVVPGHMIGGSKEWVAIGASLFGFSYAFAIQRA